MRFWLKIEGLVPRKISNKLERKIDFGGNQRHVKQKIGFIFGYPIFTGIALVAVLYALFGINDILYLLGGFFGGAVGIFLFILLLIDFYSNSRARKIEKKETIKDQS